MPFVGDIIVDMATSLCMENCFPEGARRGIVMEEAVVFDCWPCQRMAPQPVHVDCKTIFALPRIPVCQPCETAVLQAYLILAQGCLMWVGGRREPLTFARN